VSLRCILHYRISAVMYVITTLNEPHNVWHYALMVDKPCLRYRNHRW
jgi:hypothetical protein